MGKNKKSNVQFVAPLVNQSSSRQTGKAKRIKKDTVLSTNRKGKMTINGSEHEP